MNKPFIVREFDSITDNPDYASDNTYKYLSPQNFEDLIKFIHEFSANENNSDALEFFKISYARNVGNIISIRNYVGLIEMKNGFKIEILPKISLSDAKDVEDEQTRKIFLNMIKSMTNFPSKVFNNASLRVDSMNIYEIFINMYLQETRQLIKHGIKSSYITQEDNAKFYKGKLLLDQHIRKNFAHKERFYVSYEDFLVDRPENRLIKSTLKELQRITSSAENSKEINQLLISFENVNLSTNYQKDFSMSNINRNTKDYTNLIAWSKVFLLGKNFTTFSGTTTARSLLFPMETVYENYVAQKIRETFSSQGWEISIQDKGYYLFTEPRNQFALRPDIVLIKDNRKIIMDTKWKRLNNNDRANYGITQSDMYQMYAYSKKYDTSEIWLLYPTNNEIRDCTIKPFNSGDGTTVNIFPIDLTPNSTSFEKLKEFIH